MELSSNQHARLHQQMDKYSAKPNHSLNIFIYHVELDLTMKTLTVYVRMKIRSRSCDNNLVTSFRHEHPPLILF